MKKSSCGQDFGAEVTIIASVPASTADPTVCQSRQILQLGMDNEDLLNCGSLYNVSGNLLLLI